MSATWSDEQKNFTNCANIRAMTLTTRMARVTGPVAYVADSGKQLTIPLGPCLLEQRNEELVDIFWGASGQNSAALPLHELASAATAGHLVLLD